MRSHEHGVQRVEHGAGHVPVEIVRGEVQRVGIGQQAAQAGRNRAAVLVADADVDADGAGGRGHGASPDVGLGSVYRLVPGDANHLPSWGR
jgi:hypothetical protein